VKNRIFLKLLAASAVAIVSVASCSAQYANSPVLQVEAWRKSVLAGDANALAALYAATPRILGPGQSQSDLKTEVGYWTAWKSKGLKSLSVEVEGKQEPQPGFHVLALQLTLTAAENGAAKKYFVKVAQGYMEQGATWKIVAEQRDGETRLKGPAVRNDIYPADADAEKEISDALASAAKAHKHVLLIFGGNWCYDCHVLDEAFHAPEIYPTLNHNFVVAHIDIGEYDRNLGLAKKYQVPLEKGVPAAAVLDSEGKLLFSQRNQEFEKARTLAPEDILAFLNKWKPGSAQ